MEEKDIDKIMKEKCCRKKCKEKSISIINKKFYCKEHRDEIKYPKGKRVATGPVY